MTANSGVISPARRVVLEKGEMLFYESAKCLHGRPHPFVGEWYSSIFIHYVPKYVPGVGASGLS